MSRGTSSTRLQRAAGPGERWWFALLLLPALMTAGVIFLRGETIESDLRRDGLAALEEAGVRGADIAMDGRSATVLVPTGQNIDRAVETLEGVDGIADVEGDRVARTAAEARACSDLQQKIDAVNGGRGISFAGSSVSLAAQGREALSSVAGLLVRCPSAVVVAEGHADPTVIDGSTISLRRAEAARKALINAGVKAAQVQAEGFGDTFPLSSDSSAAASALNNRVSVRVVD